MVRLPPLYEVGTPAPVTDTAITEEVSPMATPAVCEDVLVHQLVQSLYRVLLLREPDAKGFDAHVKQICGGQPIEDVMRGF